MGAQFLLDYLSLPSVGLFSGRDFAFLIGGRKGVVGGKRGVVLG